MSFGARGCVRGEDGESSSLQWDGYPVAVPWPCLAAKEMFAVLARERGWESGQPHSGERQKSRMGLGSQLAETPTCPPGSRHPGC